MIGGKDKQKMREATPIQFRDLLISIAATASQSIDHDCEFEIMPEDPWHEKCTCGLMREMTALQRAGGTNE